MTVRLLVDSDGGVDDCTALWWLLRQPDVEVVGVLATWGNTERDHAAANLCRVLHAAGADGVPVAVGATDPIGPAPLASRAAHVHGDDGLGGHGGRWPTGRAAPADPAVELVARAVAAATSSEEPLHLLTLGPLSTMAEVLAADPTLATGFASVTVMGGAVTVPGNALPTAEANIGHDPEAAAAVLTAGWTSPPLLVGLDVTMAARLDTGHLDAVTAAAAAGNPAAAMLAEPLRGYAAFYASTGIRPEGTFPCHDLLAAMAAADRSVLTEVRDLLVAVDVGGSAAWGATVADLRQAPQGGADAFATAAVGLGVDAPRFRAGFEAVFTT